MARRIIRRKRISHPGPVRPTDDVRPKPNLPEFHPSPATRVVIAAPGPLRTVLMSRISGSGEVKLAGAAQDEISTIEKIITEGADVVSIFIHLGGELAGLEIARNVSRACPNTGVVIIVSDLVGVDVRRHARKFGTAWSYALSKNVEAGHNFADAVQSVARGIHWVDPSMKRVLEAIWKIASEGRDMEIANAVEELGISERITRDPLFTPAPRPAGIQTMKAGNSGIGSNFGISKTG